MAKIETEVKKEEVVSKEEFMALKAKVRRMSDNWKRFVKVHVDSGSGGTIVSLLLIALLSAPAFGADELLDQWDAPEAKGGYVVINADEGDDTDDTLTIGINTDNDFTVTIGGDEVLNITDAGVLTTTSLNAGSTNYEDGVKADVEITLTDTDGDATISSIGYQDSDGILLLDSDEGDADEDTWSIKAEADGNDLSFVNHITEVMNLTPAGALQVDSTITAGGAVDAANLTVDAAAGLDTQSEGALVLGAATADKVQIGASDIDTYILGGLDVLGTTGDGIDTTGDTALYIGQEAATSLVLGASDIDTIVSGPLTVLGSTGAGLDAGGATALFIGEAVATSVSIGKSGGDTTILGPLNVLEATGKGIDTTGAGALFLGEAMATSVSIGASDATTTILGPLEVLMATGKGIDTTGAGGLFIGQANATSVSVGQSDADTIILGGMTVLAGTGEGIDTTGAGALYLGEVTATSVNIGSAATVTDVNVLSDGGTLDVGKTTAAVTMTALTTATAIFMGADAASPANTLFDTTGAGAIDLGSADVTDIQVVTDGGTLDVGTTASTLLFTALTTGTAVIQGADADGAADTTFDTTGAGAIVVGSADVTAISLDGDLVSTTSPFQMAAFETLVDATATTTLTSADYGRIILATQAGGVTFTLPANGAPAGSWIDFMQGTPANNTTAITVESATQDTLITDNSSDSDSVSFGTGARMGGYIRCISDGGFWVALNLGQTVMTVTDTD